jgi:hypothetical protein
MHWLDMDFAKFKRIMMKFFQQNQKGLWNFKGKLKWLANHGSKGYLRIWFQSEVLESNTTKFL